jgi:hypothetical protein
MTSRTRAIVLSITAPVVAFANDDGFLDPAQDRKDKNPNQKIVANLIRVLESKYSTVNLIRSSAVR